MEDFFLKEFIWQNERAQAGGAGEGEADSLLSRDLDVRLNPRILES